MKIELNDESLPKGTEVHVNNLGTLVNGKEVEIDDEAVANFEARMGTTVADAFAENVNVHLSGAGSRTSTTPDKDKKKEGGE